MYRSLHGAGVRNSANALLLWRGTLKVSRFLDSSRYQFNEDKCNSTKLFTDNIELVGPCNLPRRIYIWKPS